MCAASHRSDIARKVGQEDVAVDVGDHQVEGFGARLEDSGVAVHDFDLSHGVEGKIVARVAHTPLVEVDGHAVFCPAQRS